MADENRMRQLVDRLNETARAYYVLDNPVISDKEWDAMYDELVRLERETQITVPTTEYSAPRRECCADEGCEEDPCERFSREEFPMRSFFPNTGDCRGKNDGCCCR